MSLYNSLISAVTKSAAIVLLCSSSGAFAADILMETWADPADNPDGGSIYDISQMDVRWSEGNQITVDIFTNFATIDEEEGSWRRRRSGWRWVDNPDYNENKNNENDYSDEKIIFGDLLIGVSGENYAFSLGDLFESASERFKNTAIDQSTQGGLYAISGTQSAGNYHGLNNSKGDVFGVTSGDKENEELSSWSVGNSGGMGMISFTFNVTGLQPFMDASSLSLSWAMSCFNDSIAHTFAIVRDDGGGNGGSNPVPEPQTLLLMLLGVVGIAARRKQQGFKA